LTFAFGKDRCLIAWKKRLQTSKTVAWGHLEPLLKGEGLSM